MDDGVWPDAQSVASWPEMAAGCANPACGHASAVPRNTINGAPLRPSLLELQQQRAELGEAVGASLLGVARRRRPVRTLGTYAAAAAVSTLLVVVGAIDALTFLEHPLWLLSFDSPEWLMAWLLAAVAQASSACLCLCGIVAASERPCQAALWIALCLVSGTFGMCAYLLTRLLRHGTLRLAAPGSGAR